MADALKAENEFFRQHSSYRAIATRCGTQYLAKQLNQILFNHIKDKLPELRTKLSSLISQTQHELAQYGDPVLTTGTMHRVRSFDMEESRNKGLTHGNYLFLRDP